MLRPCLVNVKSLPPHTGQGAAEPSSGPGGWAGQVCHLHTQGSREVDAWSKSLLDREGGRLKVGAGLHSSR